MQQWATLVGALVLLVLWHGPALLSAAWGNVGLVTLAHALITDRGESSLRAVTQAERLLHQAVTWNYGNQGAHRGLGWALAVQGEEAKAVAEWRAGGFTAKDFISVGEDARRAGRYEEALVWYERAMEVEPGAGAPWYYMGLTFHQKQRCEEALTAFSKALEIDSLRGIGISDVYFQQGEIYQWAQDCKDINKALQMFDIALESDSFRSDRLKAEAFYKRGEIYSWQGRDPRESAVEYQQALSLRPNHRWARLRLGYALYWACKDVPLAEEQIKQAIAQWPNDSYQKWPYRFLGDIYRDAGLTDKAIAAYKEVLRLDPNDKHAQGILATLLKK